MSIISDALRKVAFRRRTALESKRRKFDRDLSNEIVKIASKSTKWNILSSIGTIFIVGFAVIIFLYNIKFLPSFIYPKTHSTVVAPKDIDFGLESHKVTTGEVAPSVALAPEPQKKSPSPTTLTLNGVIGGMGEPLAVINDKILRKGDYILDAQVIDIYSNGVILLRRGKEIKLWIE